VNLVEFSFIEYYRGLCAEVKKNLTYAKQIQCSYIYITLLLF